MSVLTLMTGLLFAVSIVCLLVGALKITEEVRAERNATEWALDPAREAEGNAASETWHKGQQEEARRVAHREESFMKSGDAAVRRRPKITDRMPGPWKANWPRGDQPQRRRQFVHLLPANSLLAEMK